MALTRGIPRDDVPRPDVVRLAAPEVVAELVETLGPRLVAYMGGASHTKFVRTWREGTAVPRRLDVLRGALQATRLLLATEPPPVAQAWFTGANTHLALEAPAAVLRNATRPEEITRVVRAAKAFAS
jgi:hypothetical protein